MLLITFPCPLNHAVYSVYCKITISCSSLLVNHFTRSMSVHPEGNSEKEEQELVVEEKVQ